jgi:hypothetical protein
MFFGNRRVQKLDRATEEVFYTQSDQGICHKDQRNKKKQQPRLWSLQVVLVCFSVICNVCKAARISELLWLRHGDSSGELTKGNVLHCKPLPSNGNENMTVDTSLCDSGL